MRTLVRRLLPPVMVEAARWVRDALGAPEWSVARGGFAEARALTGWDDPSVAETQAARWNGFVARTNGTAPLGLSSESDPRFPADEAAHNTVMVFAYALARAAHGLERMTLLDWGGGLGQYGVLARALLPEVAVEYHCRDLPGLVKRGRALQPDTRFHEDDGCLARRYDLVLASSSLQYHEPWRETLARLAGATGRFLLVTRLPVVLEAPSYVVIQRPHAHGYRTAYPGWVLNRTELLDAAGASGLRCVREFLILEHPRIPGAPAPCHYRGFLFTPDAEAGQ